MSLPTKASSGKSAKSAKTKSAKSSKSLGIHDAKAEKHSSGKTEKENLINTSTGYVERFTGKPGDQ